MRSKKQSTNSSAVSPCGESINDPIHDSIFCEGSCQAWVHQGNCGGLSKLAHAQVKTLSSAWSCPVCRLATQSKQIEDQSRAIADLRMAVENLAQRVDSLQLLVRACSASDGDPQITKEADVTNTHSRLPPLTMLMDLLQDKLLTHLILIQKDSM